MQQVVVLVPAHNEEQGICKTVKSLFAQTLPPSRVIVMADNCTDNTEQIAIQCGAEVFCTVDNTMKKAGALNQGIDLVAPFMDATDLILAVDADGDLALDFIEQAVLIFQNVPNLGGLSGSIVARRSENILEMMQAIEYAQCSRLVARDSGKVHVLAGAASVFPVAVLDSIAMNRGSVLPGVRGKVFLEGSLTEDYELTLAIRTLGFLCRSTKRCKVTTDLMSTSKALKTQRLRWFRGALESLYLYGFNKQTWKIWLSVGGTFASTLLLVVMVVALTAMYLILDASPSVLGFALLPLFMMDTIVAAKRVDRRATALAVVCVPMWIFGAAMSFMYWKAAFQAVRGSARVWTT